MVLLFAFSQVKFIKRANKGQVLGIYKMTWQSVFKLASRRNNLNISCP